MATYKEIQQAVKELAGFTVKICWIAHVLSDYGKTRRIAPNRIDPSKRKHPCPQSKRPAIEGLLRQFGMI